MGLSYTWRSQKDDIAILTDKSQIKQGHHFLTVQLGLKGKIKFINAFYKGQTRYLQSNLDPALLLLGHFLFQKVIQERQIALALIFRLLNTLGEP